MVDAPVTSNSHCCTTKRGVGEPERAVLPGGKYDAPIYIISAFFVIKAESLNDMR